MENQTYLIPANLSIKAVNPDFVTYSAAAQPPKDLGKVLVTVAIGCGVWVASVFFILLMPTLFLLPYLFSHDPPLTNNEALVEFAKSDPTSIFLQLSAVIPAHLLTILLAWLVVSRGNKFAFLKTLGWDGGGWKTWLSYPLILAVFFTVAIVVGNYFPEQENDMIRMLRSSKYALYTTAFLATFTAPFVEEVVYRGILYSSFQRLLGSPAAFVIVTLLFSTVHVPQYYPSYSTIFLLLLLSLILTAIRFKTNNLLPCVILHTLFNGIQSVGLLLGPNAKPSEIPDPAALFFHLFK